MLDNFLADDVRRRSVVSSHCNYGMSQLEPDSTESHTNSSTSPVFSEIDRCVNCQRHRNAWVGGLPPPRHPDFRQLFFPWKPLLMALLITSINSGEPSTTSPASKYLSMSWKQNFGFCQGQTFEVFEFYI
jgi:hypothetical protein